MSIRCNVLMTAGGVALLMGVASAVAGAPDWKPEPLMVVVNVPTGSGLGKTSVIVGPGARR